MGRLIETGALSVPQVLESLTAELGRDLSWLDDAHWPARRICKPSESSLGKMKRSKLLPGLRDDCLRQLYNDRSAWVGFPLWTCPLHDLLTASHCRREPHHPSIIKQKMTTHLILLGTKKPKTDSGSLTSLGKSVSTGGGYVVLSQCTYPEPVRRRRVSKGCNQKSSSRLPNGSRFPRGSCRKSPNHKHS